jgi:probable rRNA maturation factor
LEITILNRQRATRIATTPLGAFLRRAAAELRGPASFGLAVCLVSDRRMRQLHRRFRGRDRTTDVLSFATRVARPRVLLGDLVIAVPTAARQARQHGHSLSRELKILLLHGYLHLLGYDHETDDGTMLRLQARLLRRLLPPRRSRGAA